MKLPEVNKKDTICVVAPAGRVKPEDLIPVIEKWKNKGFQFELGKHLFQDFNDGYHYAGTPKERIHDFQWALNHPTAKAIWCARGGYGCVQLIDQLDFSFFRKHPKWLLGYSDNTVFHQYLSTQNIPSLHSITLKPLSEFQTEESYESVLRFLQHKKNHYILNNHPGCEKGEIEAKISGGNLSILYSLLGSSTLDKFKGKILFIEDWQENWYHLDRMLNGFMRAGIWEGIAGLIVGSFTKMDTLEDNADYASDFDNFSHQLIARHFKHFKIPKYFGFPAGHINDNRALLMGHKVHCKVENNQTHIQF